VSEKQKVNISVSEKQKVNKGLFQNLGFFGPQNPHPRPRPRAMNTFFSKSSKPVRRYFPLFENPPTQKVR